MEKKRFLFLGNSHTYFNDMPRLFEQMCREGGFCEAEVSMLAAPYVTFGEHLKRETELRFALLYGHYHVLVMQQAAHSPCPSMEETLRDGGEIIRLARANGAAPVVVLPWAEQRRPERQEELNRVYRTLAERSGAELVPVGPVFQALRRQEGLPDIYWQDGEHASPWGSYAAAVAIYARLSGRTPEGLAPASLSFAKVSDSRGQEDWAGVPYPLEPRMCTLVQQIVWNTVKEWENR